MQLSADEATLMLAALACSSDGECDATEEVLIRERLAGPLARLGQSGEEQAFSRLYRMMGGKGLEWTLATIAKALPKPEARVQALRVAVELVRSDGLLTREEMEHLAEVAHGLDLSEEQIRIAMA